MCSRFILLFVDAGIPLVLLLLEKGNGSNFKLAYVHYIQNGKKIQMEANTTTTTTPCSRVTLDSS